MDNAELKRIIEKAKTYARRRGFGDEAEDFAQEYAIRYFESGGSICLKFYFIDYSDEQRANKRVLSSPQGYLSKNIRVSLDQPIGNAKDDGATIGDFIGVPGNDLEYESSVGLIDSVLTAKERMILDMYIGNGMTLKEVGLDFGVSESRVSQWLKEIREKAEKLTIGSDILSQLLRKVDSQDARLFVREIFIKGICK
ncbi:MAG: sigma-70 family RNA polymerase sigma factor [Pseudobdellovibrionaceae bacterium]